MRLKKNYNNEKFYKELKNKCGLYSLTSKIGISSTVYYYAYMRDTLSFSAYKLALYYLYNENLYNKSYSKVFEKYKNNKKLVVCLCVEELKKLGISLEKAFDCTDKEIKIRTSANYKCDVNNLLYALAVLYLVNPKLAKMDIKTLENKVYKKEQNFTTNINNELLNYKIMAALG